MIVIPAFVCAFQSRMAAVDTLPGQVAFADTEADPVVVVARRKIRGLREPDLGIGEGLIAGSA